MELIPSSYCCRTDSKHPNHRLGSNYREGYRLSYAFINPCYCCEKKDVCKDSEKIQKAIHEIHRSTDGSHLGSGNIVMSCNKLVSILK